MSYLRPQSQELVVSSRCSHCYRLLAPLFPTTPSNSEPTWLHPPCSSLPSLLHPGIRKVAG